MFHDPFQTHSMLGAHPGIAAALGFNPLAMNPLAVNPLAVNPFAVSQLAVNPLAGGISPYGQPQLQAGIPGYGGLIGQQLQLASMLAQQVPQAFGLSPLLHNPLASIGLYNPVLSQSWVNPLVNPIVAQQYQHQLPYPQIGLGAISPLGQTGYSLAPQTWIGPQGIAGQGHPLLSHLGGRGVQAQGISPWAGF